MPSIHHLVTPLSKEDIRTLHAGDLVRISGTIYAARDAAHKRMTEALEKGEKLPFDLSGQLIYYVGPTPAKPGKPIGSAGPTTSGRMDAYTPQLLELGLAGMIGKGNRSSAVMDGGGVGSVSPPQAVRPRSKADSPSRGNRLVRFISLASFRCQPRSKYRLV